MARYVWINMNTGQFSNSWTDEDVKGIDVMSCCEDATADNWKMIKYECINDEDFTFYNLMQIVTAKTA